MPVAGGSPTQYSTDMYYGRLVSVNGGWIGIQYPPTACYDDVPSGFLNANNCDGASDGTTLYYTGVWCDGELVVKAPGFPYGACNTTGTIEGPLVDIAATRVAVDDTYVYLWANGTISRAFK